MAKQRARRSSGRRQQEGQRRLRLTGTAVIGLLLLALILFWTKAWPYALCIAFLAVVCIAGGRLWRTHRPGPAAL